MPCDAGTLDLTQLAGSDPGLSTLPDPEPQAASIIQPTSEAYRFQAPVVESESPPQFSGQQYLAPGTENSSAPPPYGSLGYHQHYPHAGNVDPFHPHASFAALESSMAASTPQSRPPDPYSFQMHTRPVPEPAAAAASATAAAAVEHGRRKRTAELSAAGGRAKRVRQG